MSEWQPIETAPKDKRVLLWSGVELYCGHWAKHIVTDDEAFVVATWAREDGGHDQALINPTHWMPLPEPPKIPQCAPDVHKTSK